MAVSKERGFHIKCLLLLAFLSGTANQAEDPATRQIVVFKLRTKGPIGVMTTTNGGPVELKDARLSLNTRLLFNKYFMESITHVVRERIPERIIHAKAGGAFGYFEVTHDISRYCKAKMFRGIGKKTPIAARFSPVIVEKGGMDTTRDARGFAVKFYTEEGNFDLVGLNTPIYVFKDPLLFPTYVRAQKRNPATNLPDGNMLWDFLMLQPESLHMFLLIFGDRGIPDGFRHMSGFGIHTFEVVNDVGQKYFVRFHFYPAEGVKNLRPDQARKIAATDPDYAIRDLYNAIGKGINPSWTVKIQVLSYEDVQSAGFDVFDVTKVLPVDKYPLLPLGRMVLNKNPINYFAEIEQLAFNPANLVPGILGAPDKVFEARCLAYRDAQYYRLGANFNNIPVNNPIQARVSSYNRDGVPPVKDNERDIPNYYPNTFNGPIPYVDEERSDLVTIIEDLPNNFQQATELYVNEMTPEERERLIENILSSILPVQKRFQERAVKLFTMIHADLGRRIEEGLMFNSTRNRPVIDYNRHPPVQAFKSPKERDYEHLLKLAPGSYAKS